MEDGNCIRWFYLSLAMLGLLAIVAVMIFRYFLRITKNSLELKQADKEHEKKHNDNCQRLKTLEAKNGKEQREIETLKGKIETLEGVIRTMITNQGR